MATPDPSSDKPSVAAARARAGAARARDAAQVAMRWRPDSLLRQHLLALVLAFVLPALLRWLTPAPDLGAGLLAFVLIVLGFGATLAGLALYLWWALLPSLHRDDESYMTHWRLGVGPTLLSRHPGWLAVIMMVLGQALITPSVALWIYAALVLGGLNLLVRRFDEPRLQNQAGDAWSDYAARVPRWLPWTRMSQTLREMGQMLRDTVRSR